MISARTPPSRNGSSGIAVESRVSRRRTNLPGAPGRSWEDMISARRHSHRAGRDTRDFDCISSNGVGGTCSTCKVFNDCPDGGTCDTLANCSSKHSTR